MKKWVVLIVVALMPVILHAEVRSGFYLSCGAGVEFLESKKNDLFNMCGLDLYVDAGYSFQIGDSPFCLVPSSCFKYSFNDSNDSDGYDGLRADYWTCGFKIPLAVYINDFYWVEAGPVFCGSFGKFFDVGFSSSDIGFETILGCALFSFKYEVLFSSFNYKNGKVNLWEQNFAIGYTFHPRLFEQLQ